MELMVDPTPSWLLESTILHQCFWVMLVAWTVDYFEVHQPCSCWIPSVELDMVRSSDHCWLKSPGHSNLQRSFSYGYHSHACPLLPDLRHRNSRRTTRSQNRTRALEIHWVECSTLCLCLGEVIVGNVASTICTQWLFVAHQYVWIASSHSWHFLLFCHQ